MSSPINVSTNSYDRLIKHGVMIGDLNQVFEPNPHYLKNPGKADSFTGSNTASTVKKVGLAALGTYLAAFLLSGGKKNPITAFKTIGKTVSNFFKGKKITPNTTEKGLTVISQPKTGQKIWSAVKEAGEKFLGLFKKKKITPNNVEKGLSVIEPKTGQKIWSSIKNVFTAENIKKAGSAAMQFIKKLVTKK